MLEEEELEIDMTPGERRTLQRTKEWDEKDLEFDWTKKSWYEQVNRALKRPGKDKIKERLFSRKPVGRQGRSRENREKAARERKENPAKVDLTLRCRNEFCLGEDFGEDDTSGDVICSNCGVVFSEKGIWNCSEVFVRSKTVSKPYQNLVHFKQRLAQLLRMDPWIDNGVFEKLEEEARRLPREKLERMGKKTFAEVIKKVGLPGTKRLSANWVQARERLGLEVPEEVPDLEKLYGRLCGRFQCVAMVFKRLLYSSKGERNNGGKLKRRNIMNINYLFCQLLRLEDPSVWEKWVKFFPQLVSKKQPAKNNARWKLIVQECSKCYRIYGDPRSEERTRFDWNYIEFTREEIQQHCNYFD